MFLSLVKCANVITTFSIIVLKLLTDYYFFSGKINGHTILIYSKMICRQDVSYIDGIEFDFIPDILNIEQMLNLKAFG